VAPRNRRHARAVGPGRSSSFPRAWESHVASVLPELHSVVRLLTESFAFEPSISETLLDYWNRRDQLRPPENDADAYLEMGVAAFGERRAVIDDEREQFVESAARRHFAMLLEAALIAEWAARREALPVAPNASTELLELAARIAGSATPFPSPIIRGAAQEWLREQPWTTAGYGADVQAMVRNRMTELA
jgi:hypothetical protein